MPLYKNGIQLTPEQEKLQQQEKLQSGSYQKGVTDKIQISQPQPIINKNIENSPVIGKNQNKPLVAETGLNSQLNNQPAPIGKLSEPTVATINTPIVSREAIAPSTQPISADPKQRYIDIASKSSNEITEEDKKYLRQIQARLSIGENLDSIFGTQKQVGNTDLNKILSDSEKRNMIDSERQKIRNMTISYDEKNKLLSQLDNKIQDGTFFGGETAIAIQGELANQEIQKVKDRTQEQLLSVEDQYKKDLELQVNQIKEKGARTMSTLQRLNSLRGAGRSTFNEKAMGEQQEQINGLISSAEQNANIKLQLKKAEIEGASSEAITGIQNALAANEKILGQRISQATDLQKKLDGEIGSSFAESLTNILNIADTAGLDTSNADFDGTLRSESPYVLDKNGGLWINPLTGFPEMFKYPDGIKPVMTDYRDDNGNTLIYKNGMIDTIVTNNGQVISGDGTKLFNLPTKVEQDIKTQGWSKLNDNTLYNKDTGESRNIDGMTDLGQISSGMTEEEAILGQYQLPDGSIITASKGLINAINNVLGEKSEIQIDLKNLYRTKDDQMRLYGIGRSPEELEKAGVPVEYAKPGNIVTWTLNSSHMTGNAIDVVVPKGMNQKDYIDSIESTLNSHGLVRPKETIAMGDYGHFEYNGKPVPKGFDTASVPDFQNYYKTGKITSADQKRFIDEFGSIEEFKRQAKEYSNSNETAHYSFANDILSLVNELKAETGRYNRLTSGAIQYLPFGGNEANFQANLNSLKSKLSLNNLLELKSQGAAFGALSNQELNFITDASTALRANLTDEKYIEELEKIETAMNEIIKKGDKNNQPTQSFDWKKYLPSGAESSKNIAGGGNTSAGGGNTSAGGGNVGDMEILNFLNN